MSQPANVNLVGVPATIAELCLVAYFLFDMDKDPQSCYADEFLGVPFARLTPPNKDSLNVAQAYKGFLAIIFISNLVKLCSVFDKTGRSFGCCACCGLFAWIFMFATRYSAAGEVCS